MATTVLYCGFLQCGRKENCNLNGRFRKILHFLSTENHWNFRFHVIFKLTNIRGQLQSKFRWFSVDKNWWNHPYRLKFPFPSNYCGPKFVNFFKCHFLVFSQIHDPRNCVCNNNYENAKIGLFLKKSKNFHPHFFF